MFWVKKHALSEGYQHFFNEMDVSLYRLIRKAISIAYNRGREGGNNTQPIPPYLRIN